MGNKVQGALTTLETELTQALNPDQFLEIPKDPVPVLEEDIQSQMSFDVEIALQANIEPNPLGSIRKVPLCSMPAYGGEKEFEWPKNMG